MLAGMVWFAFAVELGDKTLAEHVDTISDTPEAKQLIEGTRATINPALDDVRDRMLGEYVEAPTYIAGEIPGELSGEPLPASTLPPRESSEGESSEAPEPGLPGRREARRRNVYAQDEADDPDEPLPEPARPGRRLRPNVLVREVEVEVEPELPIAQIEAEVEVEPELPFIEPEREPERPRTRSPQPAPTDLRLPTFLAPKPPPEPIVLHDLPLPRSGIADHSIRAALVTLVDRLEHAQASRPSRPSSQASPTLPIVRPSVDPTLPELPSDR